MQLKMEREVERTNTTILIGSDMVTEYVTTGGATKRC